MEQIQKQTLQVAKEIVVKFIEIGRISPSNFGEHFAAIYKDVNNAVMEANPGSGGEENGKDADAK